MVMSGKLLLTIAAVCRSHSTGTETWPPKPGSVASYACASRVNPLTGSGAAAGPECPAAPVPPGLAGGQRNDVFQAHQLADDRGPLCPGTAPGDVEVVAAWLGAVPAGAVGGDPAAERVARGLECPAGVEAPAGAVLPVGTEVHRAGVSRGSRPLSRRRHVADSESALPPRSSSSPPLAADGRNAHPGTAPPLTQPGHSPVQSINSSDFTAGTYKIRTAIVLARPSGDGAVRQQGVHAPGLVRHLGDAQVHHRAGHRQRGGLVQL